jgi:glycosyltransferase involved in cell wall biosynthesis
VSVGELRPPLTRSRAKPRTKVKKNADTKLSPGNISSVTLVPYTRSAARASEKRATYTIIGNMPFTGAITMSWFTTKAAHPEQSAEQHATRRTATPLVSVVITCYNSVRYLAETLTSVVTQTYPSIEIIVVDDGSSDATASIAQSYPVTYLHQQNQGVSVARNKGILHCQGEYVQFLDHDDRLLPEAIETGVRLLEQYPQCAMAVGEHRYIGGDGTTLGYSTKRAVGRNLYLALLQHNFIESPCSVLHRRSALPATGLFNETVQGAEDYELYLRIARHSELILHESVVAEYRLHNDSLSRDGERMILVTARVLEMELPYLRGDRKKLRHHDRGRVFARRHFGRRLTRELMRSGWLTIPEAQRKRKLLRRYYPLGFVALALSRLLPARLLHHSRPPCP